MASLLLCQSPGILNIDVVDIAVAAHAGAACCFLAIAKAVEVRRRPPIVVVHIAIIIENGSLLFARLSVSCIELHVTAAATVLL